MAETIGSILRVQCSLSVGHSGLGFGDLRVMLRFRIKIFTQNGDFESLLIQIQTLLVIVCQIHGCYVLDGGR